MKVREAALTNGLPFSIVRNAPTGRKRRDTECGEVLKWLKRRPC